jgi:hypothetical protein
MLSNDTIITTVRAQNTLAYMHLRFSQAISGVSTDIAVLWGVTPFSLLYVYRIHKAYKSAIFRLLGFGIHQTNITFLGKENVLFHILVACTYS